MLIDVRNIFLPLNGDLPLHQIMPTALMLSKRFGSRISAILLDGSSRQLATLAGEGLATGLVGGMVDKALELTRQRKTEIEHYLDMLAQQGQLCWYNLNTHKHRPVLPALPSRADMKNGVEYCPQVTFEVLDDTTENAIILRSRLADMTLIPHLGKNQNPHALEILHTVLFDSGRPLLLTPSIPPAHIGQNVAIAWNGSAESAMALRYALPWAMCARQVTLLHNPHYQRPGPSVKDAQAYLALHDVQAEIHAFSAEKKKIGAALLHAAHHHGADMLAIGAYSHSRLRQMILGGVTRHILEESDMTVLMSR